MKKLIKKFTDHKGILVTALLALSLGFGVVQLVKEVNATSDGAGNINDSTQTAATSEEATETSLPSGQGREEVIYANLSATGKIEKLYAVNLLHPAGEQKYEYGDFANVVNLTDNSQIAAEKDALTISSEAEDFYYQADLKSGKLPWDITISYKLDGKKITPAKLAGNTGLVEIQIHIATSEAGAVFSKNYMLQISMTLDGVKFADINSATAQIASSGTNKMLTFVTLPDTNETHKFTANVRNFELSGIQIAAVPFSTDSLLGENQGELNELDGGTADLLSASVDIKNAIDEVESGLAATDFSTDLSAADTSALTNALDKAATGLGEISAGLGSLKTGFGNAYAPLASAINALPDGSKTQSILSDPTIAANMDNAAIKELLDAYTAAATVKGTYAQTKAGFDAVESTLTTVITSLGTTKTGLEELSAGTKTNTATTMADTATKIARLKTGLTQLTDGLKELSSGYNDFHDGLVDYTDGISEFTDALKSTDFQPVSFISEQNIGTTAVQFVIKTAEIKAPEKEEAIENEDDEPSGFAAIVARIKALFE